MNTSKKTKANQFVSGGLIIKGNIIKDGIDTSRLFNMMMCSDSPDEYKIAESPTPPNLFYIHEVSISECYGLLIEQGFKKEEARVKIKRWIEGFSLSIIYRNDSYKDYEKIVENANKKVVSERGDRFKIGEKDIIIIAGFLKEKINIVHVKDKGFEETARILGINVIPTPLIDLEKEKKAKKELESKRNP